MPTVSVTYARAKVLRRELTDAERKLWGALRGRRLDQFKFRRQVPVGSYIVDFICPEAKLVIEVDGATHGDDKAMRHDQVRTQFIESRGLRVHRVDNAEIFARIGSVLDGIHAVLMEQMAERTSSVTR